MGGGKEQAEQGIQGAGKDITAQSQMTGQETGQYEGSFDIGKILNALYQYQLGMGGKPSGYLTGEEQLQQQGPLMKGLYDTTLKDLQDPYRTYESTLQPQLQATEDYINRRSQERGLLSSGIPIEALGRAGVEIAVAQADRRMAYRQQALQSAAALGEYGQKVGQQNIGNLSDLYTRQQQFGQQAKGRAVQGQVAASSYQSAPYTAQLGNYWGGQAALQALPGQALGAVGTVGASYLGRPQTNIYGF